jgi:hypothetical protein
MLVYVKPINGDIFDLDTPACSVYFGKDVAHTAEIFENFYEYVTVNLGNGVQICSDTNNYSYMAQVDADAAVVRTNVLSTSLITLPPGPYYQPRNR